MGMRGLEPTLAAIEKGKDIAFANKETLVVGGEIVMDAVARKGVQLLPVDSEHSAIFQSLQGNEGNAIRRILLTASGGPFRGYTREQLENVTLEQALNHPNWSMGSKITIDSASMMNKGFEVIEAKWLFDVAPSQIEVVVHPQSVIHSMVQFADGSVKAQLGTPDMRLPIQYAFSYPYRLPLTTERIDFSKLSSLTFEQPDPTRFRNLALSFAALEQGGNMPCILNAANEVCVAAFLKERMGFLEMSDVIERTMQKVDFIKTPTYDDYVATDAIARRIAEECIATINS
jgi:1-deoxy-D-xylulose-5-phosphate reductoisomerase